MALIEADHRITAWRRQIAQLRQDIADLESGKFELWSQTLGEPREFENPNMIAHAKEVIRMYEHLIRDAETKS